MGSTNKILATSALAIAISLAAGTAHAQGTKAVINRSGIPADLTS